MKTPDKAHASLSISGRNQFFNLTQNDLHIVKAKGNCMIPFINPGDVMKVREIKDWSFVPFGHAYFIVFEEFAVLKYIDKGSTDDAWTLRSQNADFDTFEVSKSQIKHLFAVVQVLQDISY